MRRLVALGVAAAAFAICSSCAPGNEPELTRDEYVDLYVQILEAAAEEPDSAAATARAAAILAEHDRSETDLEEFALSHVDDPGYMASVWGEIENRLREKPESVSGEP